MLTTVTGMLWVSMPSALESNDIIVDNESHKHKQQNKSNLLNNNLDLNRDFSAKNRFKSQKSQMSTIKGRKR
jgi:hypothetical protein